MNKRAFSWLASCAALWIAAKPVPGQTFENFEIVRAFVLSSGFPEGAIALDPDGTMWGTAAGGGDFLRGSVWSLRPNGGGFDFQEVHSFAGPDGSAPLGGLVLGPGGDLYGTTTTNGLYGYGTVFRMDRSGRVTTLHDFAGVPDGAGNPAALLYASDGFLYGTAYGGATNGGMVFRIDTAGQFTDLHDFDFFTDGSNPAGTLIEMPDGYFYGTTYDPAVVFRINPAGDFSVVHPLSYEEGEWLLAGLARGADGLLYGTSSHAAANNSGSLYRVDTSGDFEKLHDFGSTPDDGVEPAASLFLASDGFLYGTTRGGGDHGAGLAFHVDGTGAVLPIHSFAGGLTDGGPRAPFVERTGKLYSTTAQGGAHFSGSVYEMTTTGSVTVLHELGSLSRNQPVGGLLTASDGNLYGMTENAPWLYRLDADDNLTFLAEVPGGYPKTQLAEGPAGTLLGVSGTKLFQSDLDGDSSVLHDFGPDGFPEAAPMRASDDDIYGLTSGGGAHGYGVVYRQGSTYDVVHDFNESDGATPNRLIQARDGILYGLTLNGGTLAWGTAFRVDPGANAFESIHAFGATAGDPIDPSWLIEASDDHLYGTSVRGGAHDAGTVFRLDTDGTVTVKHSFDGADGLGPTSLMQASSGDFYGTCPDAGLVDYGSIFRMAPDGSVSPVHDFFVGDGARPVSALVQAADGALYGTTALGGFSGAGVIYRLLPAPAAPVLSAIDPTSGPASGKTAVRLTGNHIALRPDASFGEVASPEVIEFDIRTAVALSPALTPGSLNDVSVTNPGGATAMLPAAWFADFLDVASSHPFHDFVESMVRAGITAGCGGGNYCGTAPITRAQMAVFLLKAEHGASYTPPACTGMFGDVACPSTFANWIEQLANEGVTGGCGGGNYCPTSGVTRSQMAVFLLKTSQGSSYTPPTATGTIFTDVAAGSFAADWIEDLYTRNITGGCLTNPLRYCPSNTNNRQQMAVFITKTFNLP